MPRITLTDATIEALRQLAIRPMRMSSAHRTKDGRWAVSVDPDVLEALAAIHPDPDTAVRMTIEQHADQTATRH